MNLTNILFLASAALCTGSIVSHKLETSDTSVSGLEDPKDPNAQQNNANNALAVGPTTWDEDPVHKFTDIKRETQTYSSVNPGYPGSNKDPDLEMQPTRGGDDGGDGKGTSSSGKGNSGKDTRILVVPPVTTPGQTYSGGVEEIFLGGFWG